MSNSVLHSSYLDPVIENHGLNCVVVGASRGIGLEFTAQLLERRGVDRVFALCRKPGAADSLTALKDRHPDRVSVIEMDVCSEPGVADAAAAIADVTNRIDLLINCAGFLHDGTLRPEKRVEDANADYLSRSFAVNAAGVLLIAKYFHRLFPRDERCVFASLSARVGSIGDNRLGGWYGYRAAKAAQNMITRTLSVELRRTHKKILCLALHPGTTDTDLSKPFQRNVAPEQLFSTTKSVGCLLEVIDGRSEDDNGGFFAWDGQPIPW